MKKGLRSLQSLAFLTLVRVSRRGRVADVCGSGSVTNRGGGIRDSVSDSASLSPQ